MNDPFWKPPAVTLTRDGEWVGSRPVACMICGTQCQRTDVGEWYCPTCEDPFARPEGQHSAGGGEL